MNKTLVFFSSFVFATNPMFARDGVLVNPSAKQSYYSVSLPTDVERLGLKGNLKTYENPEDSVSYQFDQHGNLKHSSSVNKGVQADYSYETKYDELGRKTEVVKRMLKPQIKTWITEYTYNKKNQLAEELHLDETGVYEFARYKYDFSGGLNNIQYFNGDKPVTIKVKVKPNATEKEKGKNVVSTYKYDAYGARIVTEERSKNGELLYCSSPDSTVNIHADESGKNNIKEVSLFKNGLETITRVFSSNNQHNGEAKPLCKLKPYCLIKEVKYKYNDVKQVVEKETKNYLPTFTYDAEGNCHQIEVEVSTFTTTYQYDAVGNRTSFVRYGRSVTEDTQRGNFAVEYY